MARVLMVKQLRDQAVEGIPQRRADRDLRDETGTQRLDAVLDAVRGIDRLGSRALDAVRLADRGQHALFQRGALVGQQPARLDSVGLAEVVGELIEPVAAKYVGDND